MNNQTAYWIWIQQLVGYSNNKINSILEKFTFAEDFYRSSLEDKLSCGCFSKRDIYTLENPSLGAAESIIKRCRDCGIDIIALGDRAYPKRLAEIDSPPILLYVKGDPAVLSDDLTVGIVGTRSATMKGKEMSFGFGCDLGQNGAVVISGGAVGIDYYAHKGALQSNGKTVCVLGCGHEYDYLSNLNDMKKQILKKGAVISEYPPDYPTSRFTFPKRNRIISGLSRGVLVVEAGEKSGSLITANTAFSQKRNVFIINKGELFKLPEGGRILMMRGAVSVSSAKDILDFYKGNYPLKKKETPDKNNPGVKKAAITAESMEKLVHTVEIGKILNHKVPDAGGSVMVKKESGVIGKEALTENIKDRKPKNKLLKSEEKKTANEKRVILPCDDSDEFKSLSDEAKTVLRAFDKPEVQLEHLVVVTDLSVKEINAALFELEISGFVRSTDERSYELLRS